MKDAKKSFVFSSPEKKILIETTLNLISQKEGRSPSIVLENIFTESIFPQNEQAYTLSASLVLGRLSQLNVISAVCSIYAAGRDFAARFTYGGIDILLFLVDHWPNGAFFNPVYNTPESRKYLELAFKSILDTISPQDWQLIGPSKQAHATHIQNLITNDWSLLNPISPILFFVDLWKYVGNSTFVYRSIVEILKKIEYSDTKNDELALIKLLKQISENWDD